MDNYYQTQLLSEEWKKKANEIKERDNYQCQAYNCSTLKSHLEVHHLDYFNHHKPHEYTNDMLITLCQKCHKKEISRYKFEENLFTAMKMKGFLACDIVALTAFIYTNQNFLTSLLSEIRTLKNG